MSLNYLARYRFNTDDPAGEEAGLRDLAVETGTLETTEDSTHGTALYLDGQTSLLSAGNLDEISGDQERSFSFWVRVDDVSDYRPVFCYGELQSPNAFVWYASNQDSKSPEFYDYVDRSTDTTTISQGSWVFFTITYASEILSVHIDGNLSSTFDVGTLMTGTTDPLRIGTDGIGEFFKGAILDLRVFEGVLDDEAIQYLFTSGPNFEPPLGTSYAQEYDTRGLTISGGLVCRSVTGIQQRGRVQNDHFFAYTEQSGIIEAARIEHTLVTDTGNVKYKVRDSTESLKTVLESTPEQTIFTNSGKAILFSADGVSILNDTVGGMYFGAGRDFRITVNNDKFVVQAFSSVTEDYVTKLEISSE